MQQLHIRATETLVDQIDSRADALGFTSRAEYLRYVVRNDLQEAEAIDDG